MMNFQRDTEDQIVALLKTHLNIDVTLFQFSEISGRELLDLLNTIVHAISDKQPEKIGTEKIEGTVDRISEFLRVLKYEFPCEPEEWDVRFANADPKLIRPAMLWLLRDFEEMKKRAYLARYLEEVIIPEEIKVDPTITQLLQEDRELREQFEISYKEYEELGTSSVDDLKSRINDLKADQARLATKVQSFKRKLQNVKNVDELLKWTAKLRSENEKDIQLDDQIQRLTDEKRLLSHRQQVATDRIQTMKSHMEQRLLSLKQEYEALKNGTSATGGTKEEKNLIVCRNQVAGTRKRYEAKCEQLEQLKKSKAEKEAEFQQKQSEGAIEIPSPSQFQIYVQRMRTLNDNYKQKNEEVKAYRRELAVAMRTKALVEDQLAAVRHQVEKTARANGVSGYDEMRNKLEIYSTEKATADENKGKTLEEMSLIVEEIQKKIAARRAEFKPIIEKLQAMRKERDQFESKYNIAKQRYTNAVAEYETECMQLDEQTKKLMIELHQYQSKYHSLLALISIQERLLKRAEDEKKSQESGNPISKSIKSYTDYFQKSAHAMKKQTKTLKEQKKQIGGQSESSQKQLQIFQNLRQILIVKQECQKKAMQKQKEQDVKEQNEGNNPFENIDFRQEEIKDE